MRHLDFIHAEGGEGKKCSAGEGSLRGGGGATSFNLFQGGWVGAKGFRISNFVAPPPFPHNYQ